MPITTPYGPTPWETKEFAAAAGVSRTAASRKAQAFERQLWTILEALRALDPAARECDLAEMVLAAIDTGGKLLQADRAKLRRRVRDLVNLPGTTRGCKPASTAGSGRSAG